MSAPGAPQDDMPRWVRYCARGVGCGGGIIAMVLGVFTCIGFSPICIVAGIWQVLAGVIVVSAEAYSQWVDQKPNWQKGAMYVVISLPAFIMCSSVSTLFGSSLIFLCGVLYVMMALVKKCSNEDKLATAPEAGRST
ncbi:unnamed protein product [Meganyctiphanes norvegica]|uniref:Calcium channel flower n=1 Tax=Meganyctiphanes norvegica TaxID=48144 RepID=A0AAV2QM81_MEGNR